MKKISLFLFCGSTLAACTKDFSNLTSNHKTVPTTRSDGDDKFDVLGWGYDFTEDYLNELQAGREYKGGIVGYIYNAY